jgi:hypothetical protein
MEITKLPVLGFTGVELQEVLTAKMRGIRRVAEVLGYGSVG